MESAPVVKIEPVSQVIKKITIEIPWEEVKKELESSYAQIAKKAKIKGFRPGKVPRHLLETYYKDDAENETIERLIRRYYYQALKDNSLSPLVHPELEQNGFTSGNPFSFSATIEVLPEIQPTGYRGMNLERTRRTVTENDIEEFLNRLRDSYATYNEIADNREIRKGDYVSLDHEATSEGNRLAMISGKDTLIPIDGKTFHEEIHNQIIGLKIGDEKNVTIQYDDSHWDKRLVGKNVTLAIKIKGIKEKNLPDLDDEFVKNFEQFSSLEELKASVSDSLRNRFASEESLKLKNDIINELLKINDFEVPPSLVENQMYLLMEENAHYMISHGIPKDQAVERTTGLAETFRIRAREIVRSLQIMDAIAAVEDFKVSEEEINSRLEEIAVHHNENVDNLRKTLLKNDGLSKVAQEILHAKVFSLIQENANIADKVDTNSGVEEK